MKVKVIGSGSMWTAHNSASYLIDDSIIVDFPNGMCKYLFKEGIDPRKINNIVITHFHGDHYFDLPFYFLLKTRADDKIVNIYCSKDGIRKNNKLLKLAFPNSTKRIKRDVAFNYNHDDKFSVDGYEVSKLLVNHGEMKPAYGYIFSKNGMRFGFTGDTTMCENFEYMASVCKYLFCDCMFITGTEKHMGIDMLEPICDKYKDCTFVVSHLEDETREKFKKLKIKNVIVPEDGAVINIK